MSILFYSSKGPHGFLSNFTMAPILVDCKIWKSTEHYFQAMKYAGTAREAVIANAPGPMEAARLGRMVDPNIEIRADWQGVKEEYMLKALRAKFSQHATLEKRLLDTGDRQLVEHTTNDWYWGDGGGEKVGLNRLGHLLMQVREERKIKHTLSFQVLNDLEVMESQEWEYKTRDELRGVLETLWGRCCPGGDLGDASGHFFKKESMGYDICEVMRFLDEDRYYACNRFEKYYVIAFAIDHVRFSVYSRDCEPRLIKWRDDDTNDEIIDNLEDGEHLVNPVIAAVMAHNAQ